MPFGKALGAVSGAFMGKYGRTAAGAAWGGAGGALWGMASDDTSVIGGALTGAGLGGIGARYAGAGILSKMHGGALWRPMGTRIARDFMGATGKMNAGKAAGAAVHAASTVGIGATSASARVANTLNTGLKMRTSVPNPIGRTFGGLSGRTPMTRRQVGRALQRRIGTGNVINPANIVNRSGAGRGLTRRNRIR